MIQLTALKKGFTLIELLIVIAVIGILAGVVLTAIDPIDKINSANDAKVNRDIASIASAAEAWAATHTGTYPTLTELQTPSNGAMKSYPTPPTNYAGYQYVVNNAASPPTFYVYGENKAKAVGINTRRLYSSSNGKTCNTTANITTCP